MDILDSSDDDILNTFIDEEDTKKISPPEEQNEDSADEILTALMEKENTMSPPKKKKKRLISNVESPDMETEARIAELQAQIDLLKKNKLSSHKKEKIELCSHNKTKNDCFFCSQKPSEINHVDTSNNGVSLNKISTFTLEPETNKESLLDNPETLKLKKPRVAHNLSEKFVDVKDVKFGSKKSSIITEKKNGVIDNLCYSGIVISKPKLSSAVIEQRMAGKKIIKCSNIQATMKNGDIEGDWVTVGVIVHKTASKQSANGKNFSVWRLSDLGVGTENKTVGLFLFGEVYKEHWKTQVGTVIALLNPSIMKQEKGQEVSISLDNPKKLMEIGIAKDLGTCKGIRKSDGKQCVMHVNRQYGDYCEYHVQRALNKAKAGRMELQSGALGPHHVTGERLNAVKKEISNGVYHYGGSTLSLKDFKEKKVKLAVNKPNTGGLRSALGNELSAQAGSDLKAFKLNREKILEGGSKELNELLVAPTLGSRNLIQHLHGNQTKEKEIKEPTKSSSSVLEFLRNNKSAITASEKQPCVKRKLTDVDFFNDEAKPIKQTEGKLLKQKSILEQKPTLSKNVKDKNIEFSDNEEDYLSYNKYTGEQDNNITSSFKMLTENTVVDLKTKKNIKSSFSYDKAKLKALATIKMKGPLVLDDPNNVVVGKNKGLKSLIKIQEKVGNSLKNDISEPNKVIVEKKKGLLDGVLGHVDLNSKEGKKLLEMKSRNVGALKLAENEREEKYFDSLVKKEQMEERLMNVYEIKVSAVACRICEYVCETQSKFCYEQNHSIAKLASVIKRFFQCKSCGLRCAVYNKTVPTKPCSKCNETSYKKVSMSRERKGPKIGGETLEIRGREEKFLNSMF
ncbi:protein MCM10 homolog isoform X2 [Hydra vulgaris]|uniref:Protein MCM10 homolog n=1 Tax=Hydra vulgaris TaxID=6087 RepID=A0ABM4DGP5_HYDVU